ncbi:tyrosine-type recombinase/integrase [Thermodesulfobacteriota bacterium]
MGIRVREKNTGSGEWWIFGHHKGRRWSKKVGPEDTALEVQKRLEAKITLGTFSIADTAEENKSVPVFKIYARLWLDDYILGLVKQGKRRQSTYERYSTILDRYVFPAIGKMPLDRIKRGDIRNMLLRYPKQGKSTSLVCLIRDVTSGVMGYALDDEIIAVNPVAGITKKMGLERDKKADAQPMNPDEVSLFLGRCLEMQPAYYPFFLCAFRTGMRLGEILGLRWGDIDWNTKFIEVQRSFKNGKISPTKTGRVRRVDMSDHLIETLRELHTQRKKEALKTGAGTVIESIFHNSRGEPIAQNSIRNVYKRVLRGAGLRDFRFHDIRHTFASLLLSNGESPVYVKEQMGHSSIKMTVDIYGHLIPSSNRQAVNQLDEIAPKPHQNRTLEKTKAATN